MTSLYKYAKRIVPDENSPYTVDTLPMHKDTYFFCYGIDIDKPIEMANKIISLKEENQQLKEKTEKLEKANKEAIDKLKTLGKFDGEKCTRSFKLWTADFNELISILDIDKGE